MNRRQFLSGAAGSVAFAMAADAAAAKPEAARPNILWISAEDISPLLGCYGDSYAATPNLDRLAAEGIRYDRAYAHAPVCAPARSGIITGVYPTTLGSHNMRSKATVPGHVRCFPEYLQQAGYYCSNNVKEDYNFNAPASAWNESSNKAHWRNRTDDRPFFSVFNITVCHESVLHDEGDALANRMRGLRPEQKHDPAKARIPAYHPDIPEFRDAWARYYDSVTSMDTLAGHILTQLEEDGLADDTIVFFWGDHGTGMPRGKRWVHESGTRVPLIIKFPQKYQHLAPAEPGTALDRLVNFIDFAPTVLSLAGVPIPAHMQGGAFAGPQDAAPHKHLFFTRDRMDEWYDCIRAVRDGRYRYIRYFEPHVPFDQPLSYLYRAPAMQAWKKLAVEGKLEGAPALYFRPRKPIEELFDTEADPDEIHDLAAAPEHQERLARMRQTLFEWMIATRDLGMIPEAEMHRQRAERPEMAWGQDLAEHRYHAVVDTADLPRQGAQALPRLQQRLDHDDLMVRFWAVTGLIALDAADSASRDALARARRDEAPNVALAAAHALCRLCAAEDAAADLVAGVTHDAPWVRVYALNMLARLHGKVMPPRAILENALDDDNEYVQRGARYLLALDA
jgi:N-sulfoglucosamine sulfohydrolase